jgi:hypothetical protein
MRKIIRDCVLVMTITFFSLFFPPFAKILISNEKYETAVLNINGRILNIEIADTPAKHALGLMFRKELAENSGMLFVFDRPKYASFWMKNTLIPLSLAYIKEDCNVSEILDLEPGSLIGKASKEKVKYVIEVNRGWFEKNGIKKGYKIEGLDRYKQKKEE